MVVWLYRSEMSSSDQLKGTSGSVKKEKRMFCAPSFLCGPPVLTGRLTERGFRRRNGVGKRGVAGTARQPPTPGPGCRDRAALQRPTVKAVPFLLEGSHPQ